MTNLRAQAQLARFAHIRRMARDASRLICGCRRKSGAQARRDEQRLLAFFRACVAELNRINATLAEKTA